MPINETIKLKNRNSYASFWDKLGLQLDLSVHIMWAGWRSFVCEYIDSPREGRTTNLVR